MIQPYKSHSVISEYPIDYIGQPCSMWRWATQEDESQEVKIIAAILEAGNHRDNKHEEKLKQRSKILSVG